MAELSIGIRTIHGPSLEGDGTVLVLTLGGDEMLLGRRVSAEWAGRVEAWLADLGIPAGAPPPDASAGALIAAAVGRLVAWAIGVPAVAPRRAGRPERMEYALTAAGRPIVAAALGPAVRIVTAAAGAGPMPTLDSELAQLHGAVSRTMVARDPKVELIREAAADLGIPWRWSGAFPHQLVVGEGVAQARFDACASLSTPAFGMRLTRDKLATKRYLEGFGMPLARHRLVGDAEAAVAAAREIGHPVVVKLVNGTGGAGLSVDLRTDDEVREAFHRARAEMPEIMVESYLAVPDFRVYVVGDRVALAIRRESPDIVGDGRATVAQLIQAHDAAVAAGTARFPSSEPARIDHDLLQCLSRAGHTLDSVPAEGERIVLHAIPIRQTGGYRQIVTDQLHPANEAMFVRVAKLVRLSLAAIDFRAEAIERPWDGQRFAILEVNAVPNLGRGALPLGRAIVSACFAAPEHARVPTLAVIDREARAIGAALRAKLADTAGGIGLAAPDGLWLAGMPVPGTAIAVADAHDRMAEDPTLRVAVHIAEPEHVAQFGLGLARIDRALLRAEPSAGRPAAVDALVRRCAGETQTVAAGAAIADWVGPAAAMVRDLLKACPDPPRFA